MSASNCHTPETWTKRVFLATVALVASLASAQGTPSRVTVHVRPRNRTFVSPRIASTSSFTGLGNFIPYNISGDGTTIVGSTPVSGSGHAAYLHNLSLTNLNAPAGSFVRACSYDGSVMIGDDGSGHPVVWKAGSMTRLSVYGGSSAVTCVSSSGTVFAGYSDDLPVKWTGSSRTLTTLPVTTGITGAVVTGMSPDGTKFIGSYLSSFGVRFACSWDAAGFHTIAPLNNGSTSAGYNSTLAAVRNDGAMVGTEYIYAHDANSVLEYLFDTPIVTMAPPDLTAPSSELFWTVTAASSDLNILGGSLDTLGSLNGQDTANHGTGAVVSGSAEGVHFAQDLLSGVPNGALNGWNFGQGAEINAADYVKTGYILAMSADGSTWVGRGLYNGSGQYWTAKVQPILSNMTLNPFNAHFTGVAGSILPVEVDFFPGVHNGGNLHLTLVDPVGMTYPTLVPIPQDAAKMIVEVQTHGVSSNGTETLQAEWEGSTISNTFSITAASVQDVNVPEGSIAGGTNTGGIVNLNGFAPPAGAKITLVSTNPAVLTVPQSITISQDHSVGNFPVLTTPVPSVTPVSIIASYNNSEASFFLEVQPITLASLTFPSGNYVYGGRDTTLIVSLNGPALTDTTVSVSSAIPSIANPATATVTIPAGVARASCVVHSAKVANETSILFTAQSGTVSQTAVLSVDALTNVSILSTGYSPASVSVEPGDILLWTNNDTQPHTVTADGAVGPSSDALYPNGMSKGQVYQYTVPLTQAHGTKIYFHDRFHGTSGGGTHVGTGIAGVINVL